MPHLQLPDVDLFYTEQGSGPTVLLLHGWGCDSHDWSWQIPALLTEYRVIASDHRGHGRSSVPGSNYGPQTLANDAARLLRAVSEGEPAIVVGHSLGTVVASVLAVEHPDLVRALVLVDPVYSGEPETTGLALQALRGPDPAQVAAGLFAAAFYTPDTPDFLRTWHRRRVLGTPDHVLQQCIEELYSGDNPLGLAEHSRSYLAARKVPRLVVCASSATKDFEHSLPGLPSDRIEVLAGGHFLHQQCAPDFNDIMLDWLSGVDR